MAVALWLAVLQQVSPGDIPTEPAAFLLYDIPLPGDNVNESLRQMVESSSSVFVDDMAEIAAEAVHEAARKLVADYFGPAADNEEARYQLVLTHMIVDRACKFSRNDPTRL